MLIEPATAAVPQGDADKSLPLILHTRVVTETGGGPDKTILNSPRFLPQHGYRAMCAFMHPPDDPGFEVLRQRAADLDAPLASIPDRGFWDWRVARQLLGVCRRENVAIWHAHDYKSNALGLLLRRFHRMRLVTTAHGWVKHTRRTPLYYSIDRRCQRRYERVICVSDDLRETCLAAGVAPERCLVIDNAIDVEQFHRRRDVAEAKSALGFDPRRLLVGAVGRLSEEKGFAHLIEAVSRLIAAGHDVALAIAGDGDDRARLERLIASQPQPERFRLLGHVADVRGFYESLDVFALSSLREGLPNVVLEAMAYALPVVATRIAGVPRAIDDGRSGLLIEPGSVERLETSIGTLLRDEDCRRRLAHEARARVESHFSFAVRMEKVCAVYDELLRQPVASRSTTTAARAAGGAGDR